MYIAFASGSGSGAFEACIGPVIQPVLFPGMIPLSSKSPRWALNQARLSLKTMGSVDRGGLMSHVNFKKCQCLMSLSPFFPHAACLI